MAVSFVNDAANPVSTATTTIGWSTPATPTLNDIWICSASFRAGSGTTISGVPAAFHLIARTDSGSGATNSTLVVYWYKALGTESGTFDTITLGASSKYITGTQAFRGCSTTSPAVAGSFQSVLASGTTGAFTWGSSQCLVALSSTQGSTTAPSIVAVTGGASLVGDIATATSGGSAATNVGLEAEHDTNSADSGTTLSQGAAFTTSIVGGFILDVPAASYVPPPHFGMRQAIHRAAHYFSRVPWHEKRQTGLTVPDLLVV